MIRGLVFLVLTALVVLAAAWFADQPGAVVVDWGRYRIETSAGVMVVALVLVIGAILLVAGLLGALRRAPGRWREGRRFRRERQGHQAIGRGLMAVAEGDVAEARRQARKAESLLGAGPLPLLLTAQSAQAAGDTAAAHRSYEAMMARPETELLGVRGMLNEAFRREDIGTALVYARRAHELKPEAADVIATLFDLEVRAGDWDRAGTVLREASRRNVFKGPDLARRRAIVLFERSRLVDGEEAQRLARQAHDADPAFIPAGLRLARLLVADGRARQAARVLEQVWRILPSSQAFEGYLETIGDGDPLKRVKQVERLTALNPEHVESHVAAARAAMGARLWGQARRHLEAAARAVPRRSVYRLLAELEEAENGDLEKARGWLARAADARGDPGWYCDRCGTGAAEWQALCSNCGAFDGLRWRNPPLAQPALTVTSAASGGDEWDGDDQVPSESAPNTESGTTRPSLAAR